MDSMQSSNPDLYKPTEWHMRLKDIFYLQRNDRDALLAIMIAMTVLMGLIFLFNREPSETVQK